MNKDLKEIPINLMIDAVFNNFNDDTELMARWLFKNGYINKNKDGNYIINKKYKPPFFTTKEIKEYDYAFRYLQQENAQLKEQISKAIERLNSKQIRFINEKDYILTDDDLDEIMQILESNKEE